jgi:hypothetical protein
MVIEPSPFIVAFYHGSGTLWAVDLQELGRAGEGREEREATRLNARDDIGPTAMKGCRLRLAISPILTASISPASDFEAVGVKAI